MTWMRKLLPCSYYIINVLHLDKLVWKQIEWLSSFKFMDVWMSWTLLYSPVVSMKVFFWGVFKRGLVNFSLNNFQDFKSLSILLFDCVTLSWYLREDNLIWIVKRMLLWSLLRKLLHYLPKITLHPLRC